MWNKQLQNDTSPIYVDNVTSVIVNALMTKPAGTIIQRKPNNSNLSLPKLCVSQLLFYIIASFMTACLWDCFRNLDPPPQPQEQ